LPVRSASTSRFRPLPRCSPAASCAGSSSVARTPSAVSRECESDQACCSRAVSSRGAPSAGSCWRDRGRAGLGGRARREGALFHAWRPARSNLLAFGCIRGARVLLYRIGRSSSDDRDDPVGARHAAPLHFRMPASGSRLMRVVSLLPAAPRSWRAGRARPAGGGVARVRLPARGALAPRSPEPVWTPRCRPPRSTRDGGSEAHRYLARGGGRRPDGPPAPDVLMDSRCAIRAGAKANWRAWSRHSCPHLGRHAARHTLDEVLLTSAKWARPSSCATKPRSSTRACATAAAAWRPGPRDKSRACWCSSGWIRRTSGALGPRAGELAGGQDVAGTAGEPSRPPVRGRSSSRSRPTSSCWHCVGSTFPAPRPSLRPSLTRRRGAARATRRVSRRQCVILRDRDPASWNAAETLAGDTRLTAPTRFCDRGAAAVDQRRIVQRAPGAAPAAHRHAASLRRRGHQSWPTAREGAADGGRHPLFVPRASAIRWLRRTSPSGISRARLRPTQRRRPIQAAYSPRRRPPPPRSPAPASTW